MRILITGGLGFIGSWLEQALLAKRHAVYIMDKHRVNRERYFRGDICDHHCMEQIFAKIRPEIVIHLAAMVSRKESEETPFMAIQTNVEGTLNIAILSRHYQSRIIYAGSSEEYGTAFYNKEPVTEDTPFGYPTSIYSMTKRMSEEIVQYYAMFRGVEATTLRFFMLYGIGEPASDYRSAMIRFVDAAKNGAPLTVHDGTSRQWCYITDAVDAIVKVVERKQTTPYEVYNIGNGGSVSTLALAKKIIELSLSRSAVSLVRAERTVIPVKIASFKKAKTVLGWEAKVLLEEGIRKVIAGAK
jgi:nucleoside-diphosphate-sugar epimerase